MNRTPISFDPSAYPVAFHALLENTPLFDSSCSAAARVTYIPKDGGYYLKSAPKGSLFKESVLTEYMSKIYLAPRVLSYLSLDRDWLLTTAAEGEDCTHATCLASPERLCDFWAETLRTIHDLPTDGCPVQNHTAAYLATAEANYKAGQFDLSYCDGLFDDPHKAFDYLQEHKHLLECDTLLHGDYCLPNVMCKDWRVTSLIDLGNGGVGDRHVDLYWGAWTLRYNFGTDAYRTRFFDAYGRDLVDKDRLRLISVTEVFG